MESDQQPVPSVWARPRRGREQPSLSREQIVSEAVRLLDAAGIDALSMRKLGTRLGAGATSLYRHVANKDELIELAIDEVYGELQTPDAGDPANWRTAVAHYAHDLRSMLLRHPWVASVLGQAGLAELGPNLLRLTEGLLAIIETAGFPADDADHAVDIIGVYVIGMVIGEAAYLSMIARSGQDEQELLQRVWPMVQDAVRDHPRLRDRYHRQRDMDPMTSRQELFEYGLQRLLDGLQTRLAPGGTQP